MKRSAICMVITLAAVLAASQAEGALVFNDGGVHEINGPHEPIEIYNGPGGGPTLVKLFSGASIGDVEVYQNSRLEMLGGILDSNLRLYDSSTALISGGEARGDDLYFFGTSTVTIAGGVISEGLEAFESASIFVHGSNFTIDGEPVGYGPVVPMMPMFVLEGDLAEGGSVQSMIRLDGDATITLVPEPATIMLMAVGALAARRKRRPEA